MGRSSVVTCNMVIIPDTDIFFSICLTEIWHSAALQLLFSIISHCEWFIKFSSSTFFAMLNFLQHLLLEFIDRFFTSIYLNRFGILIIITTDNLITTAAVSIMFLVWFCVWFGFIWQTALHFFCDGLKVSIDHKWYASVYDKFEILIHCYPCWASW